MKKIILIVASSFILFPSCQKEGCKEQQTKDLKAELDKFQKEVSVYNLTQEQIQALTKKHTERQNKILEECH